MLARGHDAVCAFVNDLSDLEAGRAYPNLVRPPPPPPAGAPGGS